MRTVIKSGYPLKLGDKKYKNWFDQYEIQNKYYSDFVWSLKTDLNSNFEDFRGGFRLISRVLTSDLFNSLVANDTFFSVYSVLLVYGYMIFHLQSVFLSTTMMVLIVFSFPITALITEGVFRVTYFSSMNMLSIFIVLGIAADDVFVLFDAWRQSEKVDKRILCNTSRRMAYTWRRAFKAVFVTSSTTAVGFFANAFSPLMPIKAFGIFVGIIVPMNFLLVVLIFPAAVILYDERIKHRYNILEHCNKRKQSSDGNLIPLVSRTDTIF